MLNFKKPILSICIPTFNRSGYLYFALKSIVDQDIFKNTNNIEVVICDNCSTDLTEEITKIFTDKYPNKIKYHKNETALGDKNFEKALSLASGEVLKLHNDNFMVNDGALDLVVKKIIELRAEKPMIFFANGNSKIKKSVICNNLTELVESASYLTTWIAAFSIWKEDFDKFDNFTKNVHTCLMQTDVLFRMSAGGKKIFVYNEKIFNGPGVIKKGGYNLAKVFGKNYLSLLKYYLKNQLLDEDAYENEKKLVLLNQIIPLRFSSSIKEKFWKFKTDGYLRYLIGDYWHNMYFYTSIFKIIRLVFDSIINVLGQKFKPDAVQKYWRKRNKHNQTTINNKTDYTKLFVGNGSVGNIDVKFTNDNNELLIIENNVTIESGVKFIFKTDSENKLIIINSGQTIVKNSIITN